MKLHYTIYGSAGDPVYEKDIPNFDYVCLHEKDVLVFSKGGILDAFPLTDRDYLLEVYD